MKLTADRKELAEAAQWTARAISRRPVVPALAGMALRAEAGRLVLSATDSDLTLRAVLPAEIGEPGLVIVPGNLLANLLAAGRAESVDLQLVGNRLAVHSGRARATVATLDPAEYPELPETAEPTVTLDAAELARVVDVVAGFSARDAFDKPWQLGTLITVADGSLQVTAGTLYSLARTQTAAEGNSVSAMIPSAALHTALRGLSGQIGLRQSSGLLELATATRTVWLRTLAVDMPSHGRLFTVQPTLTVDREELAAVLRLADTVSDRVTLSYSPGELLVTAAGQDGEITDQLECETEQTGRVLIALEYLIPIVAGCRDDRLQIGLTARTGMASDADSVFAFVPLRET